MAEEEEDLWNLFMLRVLARRMIADSELESSFDSAMSATNCSSSSSTGLPDSLSAVEIETFIAKAVCGTEHEERDAATSQLSVFSLSNS